MSYTVTTPGLKTLALGVRGRDGGSQADFEMDGQYLLLTSQTEEITFCVKKVAQQPF